MTTVVQQEPYELQVIFDLINADPRTQSSNAWVLSKGKIWSLKFTAQLSVPPSHFMPDFSVWHLVLWLEGAHVRIEMYPDKTEEYRLRSSIKAITIQRGFNVPGLLETRALKILLLCSDVTNGVRSLRS